MSRKPDTLKAAQARCRRLKRLLSLACQANESDKKYVKPLPNLKTVSERVVAPGTFRHGDGSTITFSYIQTGAVSRQELEGIRGRILDELRTEAKTRSAEFLSQVPWQPPAYSPREGIVSAIDAFLLTEAKYGR